MPAARIDDAPWEIDSAIILSKLGFDQISREDLRAMYKAWRGVTLRISNTSHFFHAISLVQDPGSSAVRKLGVQFIRSLSALYFYIRLAIIVNRNLFPTPDEFTSQFLYWEQKLESSNGKFLRGEEPGTADLMLFGIIQCHCSIYVPPVDALKNDARLVRTRSWISSMQHRFDGYGHLYSGRYFAPSVRAPRQATGPEQVAYWTGLLFMILLIPVTLPLILYLVLTSPVE